jgi:hypothetical protein
MGEATQNQSITRIKTVTATVVTEKEQVRVTMGQERITIPIPNSATKTRIEVWYGGEMNRYGVVFPNTLETKVKLPALAEECEIRYMPCNDKGVAIGSYKVYPEPVECPEDTEEDDCCGNPHACTGIVEVVEEFNDFDTEVEGEESEADEVVDAEIVVDTDEDADDDYEGYGYN